MNILKREEHYLFLHLSPKIFTMNIIYGTFILSKNNDQYNGEFFNNKMKAFSRTEIKVIETPDEDHFIGRFDAYWQEQNGSVSALLEIDKEGDEMYMLTWQDVRCNGESQTVNFTGRGVKRNDLLVCVYEMHSNGL